MTRIVFILLFFGGSLVVADPGKEKIGSLEVELIYATNKKPRKGEDSGRVLPLEEQKKIKIIKQLVFQHYRSMGKERPKIMRSYETWATPMRPSKEMLVSFEPRKLEGDNKIQMVMEYWQSKRKLFSTNPTFSKGRPLYLLGPEWREGRVILKVTLLELTK